MKKIISAFLISIIIINNTLTLNVIASEFWWMPILNYTKIGDKFNCTCLYHNGKHNGQDFPAPKGTAVRASKSGTIISSYSTCTGSHYSGANASIKCTNGSSCGSKSMGNYVTIKHDDNTSTIYMHLSSVTVSSGYVVQGQLLGGVGTTGDSTGNHLHFAVKNASGSYVDPMNYINVNNPGGETFVPATFDFWGTDDNITISGTYKFWWKQSGYNNCDVNVDINGTHLATIYQDEGGYFSYDFDSTKYANGTYTIGAVLRDSSGAEKYVTRNINISNSIFDFWNFDNSATISGTYKFWWKQSGYSSSTMELYIDGAYIDTFTPDESGYFSYLFDSTQYSNGKHIIGVILNNYGTQQKYISKEIYTNNVKSEFRGWTEDCIGGVGSISIYGWVYDVLNPNTSIEIHIYIGGPVGTEGVEVHTFIADQYRPDVNDAYGAGDYHGFSSVIPVKKSGNQPVHVYAINPYTNEVTTFGDFTVNISTDTTSPVISNLSITDITETGYTLICTVTDNVNIEKILFPSWTTYNSDDDIIWHEGTLTENTATCRIDVASHNNEYGNYESHVYAYDTQGNYISASYGTITLKKDDIAPTISNIKITNISATHYTIECQVTDNLGVGRVSFPTWTLNDDGDDLIWHEGIVEGNVARCTIKTSDHNNELGTYKTHIYAYDTSGNSISAACKDIVVKNIEMPLCDSTVFRTENKLRISTFLYNITSSYQLIVTLYKNGRLIDVGIRDCSSAYEEYVTNHDVDKIKIIIWDNLSKMHPICSQEIITSDAFLTE